MRARSVQALTKQNRALEICLSMSLFANTTYTFATHAMTFSRRCYTVIISV